MTISRMLQPRQQYGLGSLVKKAVRGVKKIVKSPIGKAALLAGLGMYGGGLGPWAKGGMWGSAKGAGFLKGLMGKQLGSKTLGGWANRIFNPWQSGEFSGKHAFGLASAAAVAAPFLMGKEKPEEEDDEPWTQIPSSIADIRAQARAHYRNPGASTLSFMPNIDYVNPTFYSANGGRAGLLNGGGAGEEQLQQMLMAEFIKYKNQGGQLTFKQFVQAVMQQQQEQQQGGGMEQPGEVRYAAQGGRIGYAGGKTARTEWETVKRDLNNIFQEAGGLEGDGMNAVGAYVRDNNLNYEWLLQGDEIKVKERKKNREPVNILDSLDGSNTININGIELLVPTNKAQGGRIGKLRGGPLDEDEDEYNYNPNKVVSLLYNRSRRQEGGLMNLGNQEKDYRETGGFVDLGGKERADDVPARLSKNEFVFTADAVRAAGGGDIDAGSEVMQNMMDNLEQGGEISEESQGLEGAQAMYDQQQMLQSRIA